MARDAPRSKRRWLLCLAAFFVLGGAAVVVAVVIAASSLFDRLADSPQCPTTEAVVAKTMPALESRFDLAALDYGCGGSTPFLAEHDGARIELTSATDYPSRARLAAAVRERLEAAGWSAPAGSGARGLRRRAGPLRYSAVVKANSIAPALAIVTLRNGDPGADPDDVRVDGAVAERRMTPAERLRFATVPAFVPAFVPRGYAGWAAPEVLEYDDVGVTLRGGAGTAPVLRSLAILPGMAPHGCHPFSFVSKSEPCVPFGTTRSGIRVWIAPAEHAADGLGDTPTATVDDTLVALLDGHETQTVRPPLRRADVLAIFDSLRAVNTPAKR